MSQPVSESGSYLNFTDSDSPLTITGSPKLLGILTNSTTSGTFAIADSDGTAVTGTVTPSAGSFTRVPADCVNGCVITIANTLDATVFFTK